MTSDTATPNQDLVRAPVAILLTASIETPATVTPVAGPGKSTLPPGEAGLVSFAGVDTASAPGMTVAAAPYLHRAGASLVEVSPPGSEVVLINNRSVYQGTAGRLLREGSEFLAESMVEKLFGAGTRSSRPQVVATTQEVIRRTPPAGIAAASRGMAERPDVRDRLSGIDVPSLVIVGTEDCHLPSGRNAADRRRAPQRDIR